jgi:hypothetical protein
MIEAITMKHPILSLAAMLGLAAPAAAEAYEPFVPSAPAPDPHYQHYPYSGSYSGYGEVPPYQQAPQMRRQRGHTHVRVNPPAGGEVVFYDGPRVIRRVYRPEAFPVASGRVYAVVAVHAGAVLWSGQVQARGEIIDLSWPEQARPAVPWAYPRPYLPHEHGALLVRLDQQHDDLGRLAVLQAEVRWRSFSVEQVAQILPRFRYDQHRVQALAAVRDCISDRQHARHLSRHFAYEGARREALQILRFQRR